MKEPWVMWYEWLVYEFTFEIQNIILLMQNKINEIMELIYGMNVL